MAGDDPNAPRDLPFFLKIEEALGASDDLVQTLRRLYGQRDETRQALAGTAALPEPERAEARAQLQPQASMNEIAVVAAEAVVDIRATVREEVEASKVRAAQSAQREEAMADMTDSLLTLTMWLVGLAALTVVAALITLVIAVVK